MSKYMIALQPIDPYFFGGQATFGEGGNVNYLVRSEKLPQQSTIIGMLRKEILIQSSLFLADKNYSQGQKMKIAEKIGPDAFSIGGKNEFGLLKSISPVFLTDYRKHYIQMPLDFGIEYYQDESGSIFGSNAINRDKKIIPILKNYSAKDGLHSGFIADDGITTISDNQIFEPVEKIGIRKGEYGEAEEDSYYNQTRYILIGEYQIAVIVDSDFLFKNSLVEMGGERSTFRMTVSNADIDFSEIFKKIRTKNKGLLLLADSFASSDIYDTCEYAITETTVLRYFIDFSKRLDKSPLFYLLKRGSVLFGNLEAIINALEKPNLKRVGFNIYNR